MYVFATHFAHTGGHEGSGALHLIIPVALLVVGAITIAVIRRKRGHVFGHRHHREVGALTTLQDRFARGEIEEREFLDRKDVLDGVVHESSASSPGTDRPSGPPATGDPADDQG